jgi:large subunit ribosomal protein L28
MVGNNVSHANNKTKRLFRLNVQPFSFFSDVLGRTIRLELSVKGMRTVEKVGGLDAYLETISLNKTADALKSLKRTFDRAKAAGRGLAA